MPRVRMTTDTYHTDIHPRRLTRGLALEVDDETAARWRRNGIAADWDGPLGQVDDAHARASVADLDQEIARLQELRDRQSAHAAGQSQGQSQGLPEDEGQRTRYRGDEHPFARYGLTQQQLANLERAGFTRREHLDNATLEDLQAVEGIGPATLAKLRPDLADKG